MADDETRAARQKALAEKKRRLEEIKARRRQPGGAATASGDGTTPSSSASASKAGAGLDEYIDELLKTSTPGLNLVPTPTASSAVDDTNAAKAAVPASPPATTTESKEGGPPNEAGDASQPSAPSPTTPSTSTTTATPAKSVETFEIAIQTEEDDFPPPSLVDEDEPPTDIEEKDKDKTNDSNEMTMEIAPSASHESEGFKYKVEPQPPLSQKEKNDILTSQPFTHFLSTASKRVERLLGASDEGLMYGILAGDWRGKKGSAGMDFTNDYATEEEEEYSEEEEVGAGGDSGSGRKKRRGKQTKTEEAWQAGGIFTAKATYEFPRWTRGRDVTDIEWCPSHKEWVLASYNAVSTRASTGGPVSALGEGGTNDGGKEGRNNDPLSNFTSMSHNPATRYLSPKEPASSFLQSNSNSSYHIPNEGIIAIYNLAMPSRPEHIFCAGCPILHSQFHPTEHPKLIVGGASSGQVLVWDARVGRYPVQRSSAGGGGSGGTGGHDCELVGMKVLGGEVTSTGVAGSAGGAGGMSAATLVTASSDGKINYWSVSNLREPAEYVQVNANLSCLEVLPTGEGVACGDEKGGLHAVFNNSGSSTSAAGGGGQASSRKVVKTLHSGGIAGLSSPGASGSWSGSGDVSDDVDASQPSDEMGHFGMVTAVAARPSTAHSGSRPGTKDTISGGISRGFLRGAGGLLVTTGVDWSTKLWAPAYSDTPLMSFLSNSYDYMCDVQWSPAHPSIFATASSNGTLNLWNLATSIDQPISGSNGIPIDHFHSATTATGDSTAHRGLNRIQWSGDGRRMAVASGDKLHVMGVGEDVWKSKGDEEGRVMHNLISRGLIQEEKA